jgi:hypothetical protein
VVCWGRDALVAAVRLFLVLVIVLVLEKPPKRRVGDSAPYLKAAAPRRRRGPTLSSRGAEGDVAIQLEFGWIA